MVQMIRQNLIMIKKVERDQLTGETFTQNGACVKNGSMQSPIDLLDERVEVVSHLGRLKRSYNPSNANITNRGHDIMVSKRRGRSSYIN
jgi:carbonic anhydrase